MMTVLAAYVLIGAIDLLAKLVADGQRVSARESARVVLGWPSLLWPR